MRQAGIAIIVMVMLLAPLCQAQERRAYEGVVSWQKDTIGTVVLLEGDENSATGWIRLDTFLPITGGSLSRTGATFQAGGNSYQIDERRGRTTYSGPDGEGSRLVRRLRSLTGVLHELVEGTRSDPQVAVMNVNGRRWQLRYGEPSLWKRQEAPFENFKRIEELLDQEFTAWVADADVRRGRVVVIEEPAGMNIPLKPPKK